MPGRNFRPSVEPDSLRVIRATITFRTGIIVCDIHISVATVIRAAPVVTMVRAPGFESAVINVVRNLLVLTGERSSDRRAEHPAGDRSDGGSCAPVTRDGITEQASGNCTENGST